MTPPRKFASIALQLILPAAILATGCKKDDDIRSYSAPKDIPADATPAPTATSELGFPADMRWVLPAQWKQVAPPPARMGIRAAAAIQVSPDQPTLLMLISRGGGDLKLNVARWARQFLKIEPPDDLSQVVTHRQNGEVTSDVVDMSNTATPPARLLAAIVVHGGDSWGIKLFGPADQIGAQKARFDEFIASLKFDSTPAPVADTTATPPPPSADAGSAATGAPGVLWTLPQGWTADLSAGGFRLATIHPGNDGTEIKVSKLGMIGGGLAANVNRWRGEVGLPPVTEEQADKGEQRAVGAVTLTIHSYTGPANGGKREIVASTEAGGATWYFKLIGPTDAVNAQSPAFDQFLASLRFAQ